MFSTLPLATPLSLRRDGHGAWRATVSPLDPRFTLYLPEATEAASEVAVHPPATPGRGQSLLVVDDLGNLRFANRRARQMFDLAESDAEGVALPRLVPGEFGIVLGGELARSLGVRQGDTVTLIAPSGQVTPAGVVPRLKQVTLVGTFESGHYEYDSAMALLHIEDAEPDQAFVLRADGSIVARRDRSGFFGGGFESLRVMPGDTLVVPAQIDRESRYNFVTRALKDWTQIFANFGLGVAAIKSIN